MPSCTAIRTAALAAASAGSPRLRGTSASPTASATAATWTAAWSPPRPPYSPQTENGDPRVVRIALEREQGERVADPSVGERDPEGGAADAAAEQEDQPDGEQVECDRGCVGGGQAVPQSAPAEDLLGGHVRLVRDRAIGVAVLVV